jgi:glycosyltransferase involved in cell wall biosynthesis
VRALYFGTYDRAHPRNVNAIAALRATGVEIVERRAGVRGHGTRGALSVAAAETRLLRPRRRDFDVVIVGYPGHFDVPRARRVAGRAPLVFDAVLSLEDELVTVRRRFRDRSAAATVLRAVDFRALRLPDLVVCGTAAEAAYLSGMGARRTEAVSALQFADASSEVVDAAATLAPDVPLRLVDRSGIAHDDLGLTVAHAGVVLGSFRESRAIPPVVFEALATGAPVITADTDAARELLTDGESALLVAPGEPAALAAAMQRLARDAPLRARIAACGLEVFAERASRRVLGDRWRGLLESVL